MQRLDQMCTIPGYEILLLFLVLFSTAGFAQSRPAVAGDETQQLLQALADAAGPSGFEEPVRKIMVERMKPLADKLSYDGLGSVIAVQGTSGPRIMVDAHMDELGGMVRRVSNDGYLTMQMLGGWLDQALVDQRWTIIGSKGPVRGDHGHSRHSYCAAGRAHEGLSARVSVSGRGRKERSGSGRHGICAGRSSGSGCAVCRDEWDAELSRQRMG